MTTAPRFRRERIEALDDQGGRPVRAERKLGEGGLEPGPQRREGGRVDRERLDARDATRARRQPGGVDEEPLRAGRARSNERQRHADESQAPSIYPGHRSSHGSRPYHPQRSPVNCVDCRC
jgi:hypothetical protein